jgi:hypothetical protein
MLASAPSARPVMAATLTGWKVESNVLFLPNGDRAEGQDRPDDQKVEGLLYEMLLDDKERLDQLEAEEGHTPRWVTVNTWSGSQDCLIYERGTTNGLINP